MARRCVRYKRVRVRGQGVSRRCAKYSGSSRRRKSTASTRRKRTYKRRAAGMAKKGSRCLRFKRVRVRGQGFARRCAKYGRR